jgi:protein-S-isoprenylcysteine O-methyltransferase Ste14
MPSSKLFPIAECFWLVFLLYWFLSALRRKAAKKREPGLERLRQILAVGLAYVLMFARVAHYGWLGARFMPENPALAVTGVVMTAAGVAFAIWARWHLGANWSAVVSIRAGHELIRTGPYRAIRHPIYTGMLLGLAGTALTLGEVRGLLSFAITLAAFYAKARKEEAFLAQEFGPRFEEHAKHTGMFLPRFS